MNRDKITKEMSLAAIEKAQAMARKCMSSGLTKCGYGTAETCLSFKPKVLSAIHYGKGCFKYLIKANLVLLLASQLYDISKLRGSSRVKRGGRLSEANPLEKGLT